MDKVVDYRRDNVLEQVDEEFLALMLDFWGSLREQFRVQHLKSLICHRSWRL